MSNKADSLAGYLEQYKEQPIAILCCRYWYRGLLAHVSKDVVVLREPRAVETTGRASSERPDTEDPIPSDLAISTDAIEIVCQPTWCFHGFQDAPKAPEWVDKAKADQQNRS